MAVEAIHVESGSKETPQLSQSDCGKFPTPQIPPAPLLFPQPSLMGICSTSDKVRLIQIHTIHRGMKEKKRNNLNSWGESNCHPVQLTEASYKSEGHRSPQIRAGVSSSTARSCPLPAPQGNSHKRVWISRLEHLDSKHTLLVTLWGTGHQLYNPFWEQRLHKPRKLGWGVWQGVPGSWIAVVKSREYGSWALDRFVPLAL